MANLQQLKLQQQLPYYYYYHIHRKYWLYCLL